MAEPATAQPPGRIRRPQDQAQLAAAILAAAFLIGVGLLGHQAGCDLRPEITHRAAVLPRVLLSVIQAVAFVAVIGVPAGIAAERVVRRDFDRIADAVAVAALAYVAGFAVNLWASHHGTDTLVLALGGSTPFQLQLTTAAAAGAILGFGNRTFLRNLFLAAAIVSGLAAVLVGADSTTGVLLSVLLGWIVATAWRSIRGVMDTRPGADRLVAELERAGLRPHRDSIQTLPSSNGTRRYQVSAHTDDGETILDLVVLDRGQQAAGLPTRLYQWIRLRDPVRHHRFLSLRRAVETEVLMAMAVKDSGIRTPRLRTARQVDQDTALLAYDHVAGTRVTDLPEIPDRLHTEIWSVWRELRDRQLAHRELTTDHLLVDAAGRLWLTDVGYGEIAAEDVLCRLDGAELLVGLALRVGPDRATAGAVSALGSDTTASLLPLMQPILFSEDTAKALRRARDRDVVGRIREQILALRPEADVQPVSLERVRPRTVLSIVGGVVAFYLLATQLTGFRLPKLDNWQAWGWLGGAVAASAATYFAAALNLAGCLADRLRFLRLTTAQVAAAFVGIVTPGGALGGMAVNTRFLQRAGIPVARAVAAVGVSQVLAFTCFILLLVLFTALAGNHASEPGGLSITPSATVTGLIVGVAVLGLIAAAIPKARAAIASRIRPLITNLWPEVLQVARTPRKLLEGLGGAVALPLAATVCLWATVNAVGSSAAFASLGVAYLIAKALGSLFPTPGGVGGVEAALTAGLTAAGVPAASAATSVIVFRLLTAWLPVVPGWFAFTLLQRRGEL